MIEPVKEPDPQKMTVVCTALVTDNSTALLLSSLVFFCNDAATLSNTTVWHLVLFSRQQAEMRIRQIPGW